MILITVTKLFSTLHPCPTFRSDSDINAFALLFLARVWWVVTGYVMAHAALSDPGPTYVLAHSLMTQVTASAHPSGGRGAFGVAVGWRWRPRFTATWCSSAMSSKRESFSSPSALIVIRNERENRVRPQGGDERARVCRPNVFAATDADVSIANFHLAFPPSPSLHSSPS